MERAGAGSPADEGARDALAVANHVFTHGSLLYVSAFGKFVANPTSYVADLTPDEAEAWRMVGREDRATLLTIGAVLLSPLDPIIVLTSDGDIDPIRGIARVHQPHQVNCSSD